MVVKSYRLEMSDTSLRINPVGMDLYRVLLGNERPDIGWLGDPNGTFDNVPYLKDMKLEKGNGLNYTFQQWNMVIRWNQASNGYTQAEKIAWLESGSDGTDMVMAYDDVSGIHRQHTPEVSGGAIVNVLDKQQSVTSGLWFAVVQCWNILRDFPLEIPFPLGYTWRALTWSIPGYPRGKSYIPRGGVMLIGTYWRDWAYLPLDWLEKI